MKVVVREMNRLASKSGTQFRIDLRNDVRAAIARHKDRKLSSYRRAYAEGMTIDASQVDRAESDLKQVTSMMATDAEEGPVEAMQTSVPVSGDPWEAFASGLDESRIQYLLDVLAGVTVRPDPLIEDSINALAMDTVGDTVVGDGIVYEEYLDDLRSALGLRASRPT